METLYTAYAKSVNGTVFYFVKTFKTFPEFKSVSPLLETYGMHTNFHQACKIAQVNDKEIKQQLITDIENCTTSANVLPLYPAVAEIYNLRKRQSSFPFLLRLIGLGRA